MWHIKQNRTITTRTQPLQQFYIWASLLDLGLWKWSFHICASMLDRHLEDMQGYKKHILHAISYLKHESEMADLPGTNINEVRFSDVRTDVRIVQNRKGKCVPHNKRVVKKKLGKHIDILVKA